MKNTRLKIDNFFENKLENLVIFKGGDEVSNPLPTGGGSNTTGGGGSGEQEQQTSPFPPITPRTTTPGEAPYVP